MRNRVLFYCFTLLLFTACSLDTQNKKKLPDEFSKKDTVINKSKKDSVINKNIQFYEVDSEFNKFMPDTSIVFLTPKELSGYWKSNYTAFKSFCKEFTDVRGNSDSSVLAVRQAEIHYADLDEFNRFKFYKTWKKDDLNMVSLSAFSPNSNIVTLDERIHFFKTFPTDIQNNEVGKKTWARIEEYSFNKSTGANIHKFDTMTLIDESFSSVSFKSIFNSKPKYYILLFGASWCGPCRLQELQLKYWIKDIDTFQVKIVGFSIDDNYDDWKKYINEDKFPWNSYLLKNEMNNQMIKSLGFQGVPRNFLLNDSGTIVLENIDIRKILQSISR